MKIIIIGIFALIALFACSDPDSPEKDNEIPKEYSIISNFPWLTDEQQCALLIIDKESNITKIGNGLFHPPDFSVTEDGSLIVYRALRIDNRKLVIVISDVDNLVDTYFNMESAMEVKVSPDGKYIAFVQSVSNQDSSGLLIMNIDGNNIYKLIDMSDFIYARNWDWAADSKGINYELFTNEYKTYYIDKDGNNNPVEIDPVWIHITSTYDKTYYSLEGFERAGLPADAMMDSVGFYYNQIDDLGEKAWTVYNYARFPGRTPIFSSYFLGYDFETKTEKFLIDTTITSTDMLVNWSPDYNDIAVVTREGLYITQIFGTQQKVLDYNIDDISPVPKLKWITKRD